MRLAPLIAGMVGMAVLGLAGCLPYPHCEQIASDLTGTLRQNDEPLSGVRMKRVLPGNPDNSLECSSRGTETMTDATGHFRFPGERAFRAVVPLYGDPWAPVTLCAEHDGRWVKVWEATHLGRPSAPATVELVCDFSPTAVPGQMCQPVSMWWDPSRTKGRE